ncbi:MAG: S41 family peptidase [Flavobacteriales bacterium]
MSEEGPKPLYWLPALLTFVAALGIWFGTTLLGSKTASNKEIQKLEQIFDVLDQQYVDKINKEEIFEETISELLHKLDPHSNYVSAKDIKLLDEQTNASFGGIGVRFLLFRDTICVTHVNELSPAQLAGLERGDRIITINNKLSCGKFMTNEKVMSRLKGVPNTQVKVTILRKGKKLQKTITRGIIPIQTVNCSYLLKEQVGYIKIAQFSIPTANEFKAAAERLLRGGMKKLVLDLRGNGGGTMETAIQIADEFLPAHRVILSSKGLHSKERKFTSTSGGLLENIKVAVLIDAQSASASEILAGALQDNDRAVIVGRRSYGKGLIQQDKRLSDGSNIRITVARYYTPSGRSIQRPYKEGYDAYRAAENRAYEEEYFKPDSSIFVDSLKYKTRKGRVVYGGGGIMPDVFVPGDTTGTSMYLTELLWAGAFNAFAFDYLNQHPVSMNLQQFITEFKVNDALLLSFTRFAQKEFNITYQAREFTHSKRRIAQNLKAELASHLFTENGYYRVVNTQDKEIQRALMQL